MDTITSPSTRITEAVTAWPGVTVEMGSMGELSFRLGKGEIGHLHGDTAAHFMFDKKTGAALKAEGRVVDHPIFPGKPGPAARRIRTDGDIRDVIALMRLSYERMMAKRAAAA